MKTAPKYASLILCSLLPACGQQLVEYGLVGAPPDQSVTERDFAMEPDLASLHDLSMDASLPMDAMLDLARPFDLPIDGMPVLSPQSCWHAGFGD